MDDYINFETNGRFTRKTNNSRTDYFDSLSKHALNILSVGVALTLRHLEENI